MARSENGTTETSNAEKLPRVEKKEIVISWETKISGVMHRERAVWGEVG